MTRSRNADDFLKRYFDAQRHYKNFYRPRIDVARSEYKKKVENNSANTDYLLEAQLRQYLIDSLLKALNWRLDSETNYEFPNLVPEAQIQSSQTNNIKRLDYLGLDSDNKPLLIVETKRPSSNLPQKVEISGKADFQTPQEDSIESIICSGLRGEMLTGVERQLEFRYGDN